MAGGVIILALASSTLFVKENKREIITGKSGQKLKTLMSDLHVSPSDKELNKNACIYYVLYFVIYIS